MIAVTGLTPAVQEDPARVRPVDLPLLLADNRKLRQLGWSPRLVLGEALEDLWTAIQALERGESTIHISTPN